MAPINFEDNIREKLDEREIQPSADAWKKLSNQLDAESDKPSAAYFWFAIAASFIGILILTSLFFNQTNSSSGDKTELVEADASEKAETKEIQNVNPLVNASEEFKQNPIVSEEKNSEDQQKKAIQNTKIEVPIQLPEKTEQNTEAVAKAEISTQKKLEGLNPLVQNELKEDPLLNAKVAEVVAKVELMQKSNEAISSEEIEVLLATAQREIQNERILHSTKVDPAALLGDVELELDQSFRDKVFNALGDGFLFIRTAVVDRNN